MSESFLNRWARRKTQARDHDDDAPELEAESQASGEAQPDPAEADAPPDEETKERWIAELEKVDIDSLEYEDDFAVYLKSWVPGALRQRALRKLWTSHPTLACLDGLNDYEEDFTDAATVVANMKSDWLPGRGYKFLDSLTEDEVATEAAPADDDEPRDEAGDPGEAQIAEAAEEASEEETSETPDDKPA